MRKMMLGSIGILIACSSFYSAVNAQSPATPAAPATTPAAATPVAAPAATPAPAPAATPAAAPAAPAAATVNLSGKWTSNPEGTVTIEQTGDKIVGTYEYKDEDGITRDGKIEGAIKDKMIQAKWYERPKVGSGEERGDLEWKISDDGKMLAGWYRVEGDKEKDDWNLSR